MSYLIGKSKQHHDETRSRIIATALELISDHGFAATSTREISERLGFTKAALYYHFRTKDELLLAVAEPVISDLVALVDTGSAASSLAERRRIIEGYVALVASHAGLIKVLQNDPSVRKSEALRILSPVYVRLVQILSGVEEPDLRQKVRVRAALGAVHSALLRALPQEDSAVVREIATAAAFAVLGLRQVQKAHNRGC